MDYSLIGRPGDSHIQMIAQGVGPGKKWICRMLASSGAAHCPRFLANEHIAPGPTASQAAATAMNFMGQH
jgi:hypothetical protein